jgi:hypothetical protein
LVRVHSMCLLSKVFCDKTNLPLNGSTVEKYSKKLEQPQHLRTHFHIFVYIPKSSQQLKRKRKEN